jgi:hypothetical protein
MSDPIVEVHYVKGGTTHVGSNNVQTVSIFFKRSKFFDLIRAYFLTFKYAVNELLSNKVPYNNRNYFVPINPNVKGLEANPASGFVRNGLFDRYIYEPSIVFKLSCF